MKDDCDHDAVNQSNKWWKVPTDHDALNAIQEMDKWSGCTESVR